MAATTNHIFEFASFRLDPTEKNLTCDGAAIAVTPKVFDTLKIFVENPGRLIEKTELMEKLWHERFVEESNLTFNIKMLRKALGDDASRPRFIETVPKRGYRFIADVRRLESNENGKALGLSAVSPHRHVPLSQASPMPSTQRVVALAEWRHEADTKLTEDSNGHVAKLELAPARPVIGSRSKYLVLAAAGLVLGAITLGYYFLSSVGPLSNTDGRITIVVLPSKPINTANREEIYEIGIADSLIHKLSSMKGFVVRPLSAIRKYVDIDQDAIAAGKEQGADYVLASNYQLADGKIRVTSQLLNVRNGQIEETYTSDRDVTNLLAMQDAIASDVGNMLLARFATTSSGPVATRGTSSEEAYRKYLQGMYLYDRRTLADSHKAAGLLEQAIVLDPNYARAWAGKAHVHRALGNFGGNTHEEYKNSIEAIDNALRLDENLADAHSALCENKSFYEWDFDGAERECRRAIELDANSGRAHDMYARYLYGRGRFDEAIVESKTAIDLEPTSLFIQRNYGISLYYARRYVEAITQFKRVAEIDSNFVATYAWLVPALNVQGREAEAFEWFLKWQTALKTDDETVQAYEKEYKTRGWPGVGQARVRRFDERKIRSYFLEACLTVHTGEKDKAFEYLEKSFERREWGMSYLHTDPSLDSLRGDPRFENLVSRVVMN